MKRCKEEKKLLNVKSGNKKNVFDYIESRVGMYGNMVLKIVMKIVKYFLEKRYKVMRKMEMILMKVLMDWNVLYVIKCFNWRLFLLIMKEVINIRSKCKSLKGICKGKIVICKRVWKRWMWKRKKKKNKMKVLLLFLYKVKKYKMKW